MGIWVLGFDRVPFGNQGVELVYMLVLLGVGFPHGPECSGIAAISVEAGHGAKEPWLPDAGQTKSPGVSPGPTPLPCKKGNFPNSRGQRFELGIPLKASPRHSNTVFWNDAAGGRGDGDPAPSDPADR